MSDTPAEPPRDAAANGTPGPPGPSATGSSSPVAPGGAARTTPDPGTSTRPDPQTARAGGTPGTSPGAAPGASQRGAPPPQWPPGAALRQPSPFGPPKPPTVSRFSKVRPAAPARIPTATLWSSLVAAVLSGFLLGDGLGVNLLIVAVPLTLAAYFAATAAGRRVRPWTLVWAVAGVATLVIPALRDAGWPTFLAIVSALALGSLALHGGRRWPGVLLSPLGLLDSLGSGMAWAWTGVRERADGTHGRWGPVVRTILVAALLLVVFGALFAGADAAFADLLGSLIPDISVADGPWRFFLFCLGLVGAIAAARTAAAPLRWDRVALRPGRARARLEWALPLVVLNLLFAAFISVQLAVLFGGYDKVLRETGLTYAEYARQGFWQLLWATLLTLLVIGLALRWAPRDGTRDRTLVRAVLGTLCLLTLVVVASALRRLDLYVDAYGLTRLRISVASMELWLGLVIVLIMVAGVFGARLLPRAVAASAAGAVLVFGLISPDAIVAERNVERYETSGKIDIGYLDGLSADAVPALDKLPEPLRSCALRRIAADLADSEADWYATSLGEARARRILDERKVSSSRAACAVHDRDRFDDEYDPYDPSGDYDRNGDRGDFERP